jgi:hypothetical protein
VRAEEITLAIFEKYTPQELTTTASEMAQAIADKETAETEKKMSDGVFSERIKTHAAKVSELAQRYNKGGETAQIGCTIRYDIPTVGKKSYVRMDTEETVEVHDMTLGEKQETLQFPLSTQMADADKEKPLEPGESREEFERDRFGTAGPIEAEPKPQPAITFKDIQAIAKHIAKLAAEKRDAAIAEMAVNIAPKLLAQKSAIGPDGRIESIDTPELATELVTAWLKFAVEEESKPPNAEELTKLCPYPGCIDFAFHEGDHRFPADHPRAATDTAATELQPQKEAPKPKRTRKTKTMRGQDAILPDPRSNPEEPRPGEPGVH